MSGRERLALMGERSTIGIDTLDPPPLGNGEPAEAKATVGQELSIKGNLNSVVILAPTSEVEVVAEASERLRIGKPGGATFSARPARSRRAWSPGSWSCLCRWQRSWESMPDTRLQQRVDIRPAPWRMVLLVLGIAVFTIVGFFMMTGSDDIVERAAGLLAIVFFGGFGSYALYRLWRGQGKVALSPAGLEITMFSARPVVIPWGDIETIGFLKLANQEITTVRLKSYHALLGGLTDAEEQAFLRGVAALRYVGHATAAVARANDDDPDDIMEALAGTENAEGAAGQFALARAKYGAEILLPWNMRDRGAQAFAEYLEQWRRAHS